MSRIVGREFLLNDEAKDYFVKLLRLYSQFSGCRILAHCCMDNHFHLLLEVPPKSSLQITDQQLLDRLSLIYSELRVAEISAHLTDLRQRSLDQQAEDYRQTFLYRMHDLSQFMKVLKQRMTAFVNRLHNRKGILWEERFKSILIEDGHACRVMAAYIDLNPVRACLVSDTADYKWSSYGQACAGNKSDRQGLTRVMENYDQTRGNDTKSKITWRKIAADYRWMMFEDGRQASNSKRPGIKPQTVETTRQRRGQMTPAQLLRCRVLHFTQGTVLGSKDFVETTFQATRNHYHKNRKTGPRHIPGATPLKLYTTRQLPRPTSN
ncbi:MAG: transposase [Verrucomicrobiota bacterium]